MLTKNFEVLQRKGQHRQRSLTNVVMELKKCANHPWLVDTDAAAAALGGGGEGEGEGEGAAAPAQSALEQLVSSCGRWSCSTGCSSSCAPAATACSSSRRW